MRLSLFPTYRYHSTYDIPFEKLYKDGVRGVIFDVDNTLVRHNAPADDRVRALFASLRDMGMRTCLISNNHEARVRPFAQDVGTRYICDADKPKPAGYREAARVMGLDEKQAVFVGDQIYTDILGANLAGIKSILVAPLGHDSEIQIRIKRALEAPVLRAYSLACKVGGRREHCE